MNDLIMNDLIRREDAIDAIHEYATLSDSYYRENHELVLVGNIEKTLLAVPAVEPQIATDCISRQAAIDTLNDEYHGMISDESMKIYQIINWLNDLPSAQSKPKIGKWTLMSEKPPIEKKRYLAINKYSKEVDIYFWNGKTWIRRIAEYKADEIEAWMPLPEPYEED